MNPSIITSYVCDYQARSPLGYSCLSFKQLESRLCLDMHLNPAKGTNRMTTLLSISNAMNLNKRHIARKVKWFIQTKYIGKNSASTFNDVLRNTRTLYGQNKIAWYYKLDKSETMKKIRHSLLTRAGDVEKNPGPDNMTLVSQNCRGLKNTEKLKQIMCRLNKSYRDGTNIIALQDTHLDTLYIKYSWSGNIAVTSSLGAKGGVIMLLSNNVNIIEQIDIDCDSHILLTEIISNNSSLTLIIVNLHSPCAHDQSKVEFFDKIRGHISRLVLNNDNSHIVILGDFNTTFWPKERINTRRSKQETKVAKEITEMLSEYDLIDSWNKDENTMTWRHGDKMSRIDRIRWSASLNLIHKATKTDWSLTSSDHSAVIVHLTSELKSFKRSIVTRVDTSFMGNVKLRTDFLKDIDNKMMQLNDTNLNPHGKLEFLKVAIRSSAIEIATNHKKESENEFKDIQKGIAFWQNTIENSSAHFRDIAKENLDCLMTRRDKYLNERGKYLSERSKTKWYQEGEKSTKYFLNLHKAKSNKNEMSELVIDGEKTRDINVINKHVEEFYVKLYEKGNKHQYNTSKVKQFLSHLNEVPIEEMGKVDARFTVEELYETLKDCSDSAPGPDGIPYSIIKLTWKHFGKLLLDSWEFSERTGVLAPSHNSSYLRLLPKEGKDISTLKNWRPITLSNCDFKIITKTLSWRLAKALDNVISTNQTAYMQNRQISDNLNVMLYTVEQTNNASSMLVSLDAEKAFDSIEHWYIKEVLNRVGLTKFVKIFDTLYRSQKVEIILNGSRAGQYEIKNGVKQGDALSCILFILGVEPLLQNINKDDTIRNINNPAPIPKALAYADDIACLINPDQQSLQKIFDHYDVLTSLSGLNLNADKTEIINKGGLEKYTVNYNGKTLEIKQCEMIKINGILLSYDTDQARENNIAKMLDSVKTQLHAWSRRNLSILGKIQIFKTFGLSQILYTLSTVYITKKKRMF